MYPEGMYAWLFGQCGGFDAAWDCGTGNGQVAGVLAERFAKVCASDMSASMIEHAVRKENIEYRVEAAESPSYPDQCFDIVTVAQAIHWFRFEAFYAQVRRVLKPGGLFAAIGYGLVQPSDAAVPALHQLYHEVLGKYWDAERRYIDEGYQSLPFPFEEIAAPAFYIWYDWSFEHFLGYIETWSAVQHYRQQNGSDPVEPLREALRLGWQSGKDERVSFPVLLRAGR